MYRVQLASGLSLRALAGLVFLASSQCLGEPVGGHHSPIPNGMRYAGPIVYTNEKPPIISFPPPPRDLVASASGGNWGKNGPSQIRYVPMPHHDLPILIYQSSANPPIHVVNPPQAQGSVPQPEYLRPQQEYNQFQGDSYGASSDKSNAVQVPAPQGYGPPPTPPNSYGPSQGQQQQHQHQHHSSGNNRPSYGPPKTPSESYGPPQGHSSPRQRPFSFGFPKFQFSLGPPSDNEIEGWMPGPPPKDFFDEPSQSEYSRPPPPPRPSPPKHQPQAKPHSPSRPAPHIMYHGHPPIHVLHQNPKVSVSFSPMPQSSNYGVPQPQQGPSQGQDAGYSGGNPGSNNGGSPLSTFYGAPIQSASASSSVESYGPPPPRGSKMVTLKYGPPSLTPSFMPGPPPMSGPEGYGGSLSSQYGGPSQYSSPSEQDSVWEIPPIRISSSYDPPPRPRGGFFQSMLASFASPVASYSAPPKSYKSMIHNIPKRKSKYAIAPKSWHKPPIIIYAGVKPPVHVFKKDETEAQEVGGYSSASTNSFNVNSNQHQQQHQQQYQPQQQQQEQQSYTYLSNPDSVSIAYGSGSSNSGGEVFLPSASAPRPTIIKPISSPPLRTIYVNSGPSISGPFKTYLVSNSNPVQVTDIGYTSPSNIQTQPQSQVSSSSSSSDLDTAASSIPIPGGFSSSSIQRAKIIHSSEDFGGDFVTAESRVPPTPYQIRWQEAFKRSVERHLDDTTPTAIPESVEDASSSSISVPLSLIVSTESTENVSTNPIDDETTGASS